MIVKKMMMIMMIIKIMMMSKTNGLYDVCRLWVFVR